MPEIYRSQSDEKLLYFRREINLGRHIAYARLRVERERQLAQQKTGVHTVSLSDVGIAKLRKLWEARGENSTSQSPRTKDITDIL